jgi:hypothetical protein
VNGGKTDDDSGSGGDDDDDDNNNNNNNLFQYCHMKNFTYNSSSHYILLRESVILYLY